MEPVHTLFADLKAYHADRESNPRKDYETLRDLLEDGTWVRGKDTVATLLAKREMICSYYGRRVDTLMDHIEEIVAKRHVDPVKASMVQYGAMFTVASAQFDALLSQLATKDTLPISLQGAEELREKMQSFKVKRITDRRTPFTTKEEAILTTVEVLKQKAEVLKNLHEVMTMVLQKFDV
jgi:hypothetical protein